MWDTEACGRGGFWHEARPARERAVTADAARGWTGGDLEGQASSFHHPESPLPRSLLAWHNQPVNPLVHSVMQTMSGNCHRWACTPYTSIFSQGES